MKTCIISTAEINAGIIAGLAPYVGEAAYFSNLQPIVSMILDNYFYGDVLGCDHWSIVRAVSEYGVPTDPAEDIALMARNRLIATIQRVFGPPKPSDAWDYKMSGSGDIKITLMEMDKTPSMEELFKKEVRDGVANGDWYPENVRRLVGV